MDGLLKHVFNYLGHKRKFKEPGFAKALKKYNIFDEYKQKGVPYAIYSDSADTFNNKEPGVNEILQKWLKIE